MENKSNDTVEFVGACSQLYWKFRNYVNDLKRHKKVKHADFSQSVFGPDPEQWPGSPVGFGWDIEVIYISNPNEETYTFDVTFESGWSISAVQSRMDDHGLDTVEEIIEHNNLDTPKCINLLYKCSDEFLEYCKKRLKNV